MTRCGALPCVAHTALSNEPASASDALCDVGGTIPCRAQYMAALEDLRQAASWAAGNATAKAQVAANLFDLTIAAQKQQQQALATAAELLAQSLAATEVSQRSPHPLPPQPLPATNQEALTKGGDERWSR